MTDAVATPPGEGKTILAIVEDSDLRDLLSAGLEPEGYILNFEINQLHAARCVRAPAKRGVADLRSESRTA